jgi:hypothetical protein
MAELNSIHVGHQVDKLITMDLPFRGVIDILYPAAREKAGAPLTMLAAERLLGAVKAHDIILIATGWPDRPHISPEVAETDGPPGAALLGRALHRGLKALPFFLVETRLIHAMKSVTQSAGFRVLSPEEAIAASQSSSPLHGAAVLGFPTDPEEARQESTTLLNRYKPQAVITIEKGGMNEKGIVHTSRGHDTTEQMAKVDFLVAEARSRNILTIGIGDGGNEVGMGNIRDVIRQRLPFGAQCRCPCGQGIAPVTEVDVLVTATVSNWAAYGISACLAWLLRDAAVMHEEDLEKWVLYHASDAGLIDGISGFVEPGADGLRAPMHGHLVELLKGLVEQGIHRA